jgi:hypothetical protein
MARKLLTAIAVLATLASILVVAELWVGARYADSSIILGTPEIRLPADLVQYDPVLGTHFRPNSEKFFASPFDEFNVYYQINEMGLRDSGMISTGTRPPLVLFLGDAFVEGWGVMPEVTFIRELQRKLRTLDDVNISTRLLNAGMTGFGAAQSYLLGERLLQNLEADAIVFVYTSLMPAIDDNFLRNAELNENGVAIRLKNDESMGSPNSTDTPSPLEQTTLYKLVRAKLDAKTAGGAYPLGDPERDIFAAARESTASLERLHETSLAHIAALARIANEKGIPFVLVHVPLPHQVADDEWSGGRSDYQFDARIYDTPEAPIIEQFCATQKIQCVMTTSMFRTLAEERSSRVYFRYHHVLTAVGHRALVEMLLSTLQSILPTGDGEANRLSSTY